MTLVTINNESYSIDPKLIKHWDRYNLEVMKKSNNDRVYLVDGRERMGKSTWVFQQAGYMDPSMFKDPQTFVSRVCFSPDDFFHAVRTVKNGVIVFDEAFRGFSSRAALSKVNRKLIQALMEMGQNNNIVFIVLPSFFLLDIYPAMLRSDGLFNMYLDKRNGKRCWRGYNKRDKNRIFQYGIKKGWSYNISTNFKGNFYNKFPGGKEFQDAYLEKKYKALITMDKEINKKEEESRFMTQRNNLISYYYTNHPKISFNKFAAWLGTIGVEMSGEQVRTVVKNSGLDPTSQQITD